MQLLVAERNDITPLLRVDITMVRNPLQKIKLPFFGNVRDWLKKLRLTIGNIRLDKNSQTEKRQNP